MKVIKERIIGKVKDRGEAKKPQGFLNREQRRKYGISVVNDQLKNRNVAMANNQCGFGLILTTHLGCIIFLWWSLKLYDRRVPVERPRRFARIAAFVRALRKR